MAKTTYKTKSKNGKEYYFHRLRHKNLKTPKDLYGKTVKELQQKIKKITRELDYGVTQNKNLFGNFLKDWLYNAHLINKKASTKERYDGIFRNYIENSDICYIEVKELNASDIQEYYKNLITEGRSIASIKNLHKVIAPAIRYAYDNNLILKDFSKSIVLPKDNNVFKQSNVSPLSKDQQQTFISHIKGHSLEALFITALYSGLRQGELFALTWEDIDFNNNYITVNKSYKLVKNITTGSYEGLVQTPKTIKGNRTIPIPVRLTNRLKQHKIKQSELRLQYANLYQDNSLIFCNEFGKYLDSRNVGKVIRRIFDSMGLQHSKFHDLRHTYATRLFELGENPKTVQTMLGHSNISITLDTYTHVLDNIKERAISKLDDLYIEIDAK